MNNDIITLTKIALQQDIPYKINKRITEDDQRIFKQNFASIITYQYI